METPGFTVEPVKPTILRRRPSWFRPGLIWFALDLLAPTGLLYVMLWRGSSLYVALLASATFSAVTALASYRRGMGSQRLAPYMLAMTLAGFAIAFVSGSDRFLLAKESVLTAMCGLWFLRSLWADRPLTYQFTKPLLEGRFRYGPDWELLWERDEGFRHTWRVSTVIWSAALMLDAVLRVVMAYTLPVNAVPALQTGLMITTTLLMQPVTLIYYRKAGLWALVARPYPLDGTPR